MIFKIDFKLIIPKLFNMIYYNDKLHLLQNIWCTRLMILNKL